MNGSAVLCEVCNRQIVQCSSHVSYMSLFNRIVMENECDSRIIEVRHRPRFVDSVVGLIPNINCVCVCVGVY